ncbi:C2H2 and C2HC zinc fingers superfamily protein [Zea mays]|uniref:C2H2 and C2HC zinc fingers superfamily protein n=1 Tax=Zea mays TaxID=4577 RepID=A0A1D6FC60_MAIZE|nr:C2H2 and C2HC zinc fingers superfamily protein [Zea mays]AQK89640.1 C2H2 and C2HC zinc fingers superfamily protein [Zea mays]
MPLGKYYCDYCDKQFQDTPAARKRHLQGVQHQRARALWYDSIRHQDQHGGASSLLLPDGTLAKGICHHFVRTGLGLGLHPWCSSLILLGTNPILLYTRE